MTSRKTELTCHGKIPPNHMNLLSGTFHPNAKSRVVGCNGMLHRHFRVHAYNSLLSICPKNP